MNPIVRPSRGAITAAQEWARRQIKRHDPAYGRHLEVLCDELAWHIERREMTLARLHDAEAAYAQVIPIHEVRDLLTRGQQSAGAT